jgi:hypothetical protein
MAGEETIFRVPERAQPIRLGSIVVAECGVRRGHAPSPIGQVEVLGHDASSPA